MPQNDWNATLYDQKHSFVSEYGKGLIELLAPQPGERILDLGCGTGHLAQTIAATGARVVGIDSSASMIELARQSYPAIKFFVMDGKDFSFPEPFDAIFSNAALHWMTEPEKVVERIVAALKPGGRFIAEFGGRGNVEQIVTATQQALHELAQIDVDSGWYFPSIGEYATLLEQHGLTVRVAVLYDRPTRLEDGEKGLSIWLTMFGDRLFNNVPAEIKQQAIQRVEKQLRSSLFHNGDWVADYRRLRIVAYL